MEIKAALQAQHSPEDSVARREAEVRERHDLACELLALGDRLETARREEETEQPATFTGTSGQVTAPHAPPSLAEVEADEAATAKRRELRRQLGRGG